MLKMSSLLAPFRRSLGGSTGLPVLAEVHVVVSKAGSTDCGLRAGSYGLGDTSVGIYPTSPSDRYMSRETLKVRPTCSPTRRKAPLRIVTKALVFSPDEKTRTKPLRISCLLPGSYNSG